LDAYVFATGATQQAISTLLDSVGTTVRVACPVTGDWAVYVAVEGSDQEELDERVDTVLATTGLSGAVSYQVSAGTSGTSFPTHATVSSHFGLGLHDVVSGTTAAAAAAAAGVSGVIGVAILTGSPAQILVEVTASGQSGVTTALAAVDALSPLAEAASATGETANGAGF
jgi:hypothetical protein